MTNDLYSFYQNELFKNWYIESQNLFHDKDKDSNPLDTISLNKPPSVAHQTTLEIEMFASDPTYRSLLLEQAIVCEHPRICDHTYLLLDLSDYKDTPYQSLIFSYHDTPQKTLETTSDILLRLADNLRTPLEWSKLIGESLGYKQRIPYIAGETILLPERGYSKRPSTWLFLHQVQQVEYDASSHTIYFYLKHRYQLQIYGEKRSFVRQLERACNIYSIQKRLYEDILELGQNNFQALHVFEKNIVQRHVAHHSTVKPHFTFYEYFEYLTLYLSNKQFYSLFNEDNPYLEDVQKRFHIF